MGALTGQRRGLRPASHRRAASGVGALSVRAARDDRGFTLVELLVVLIIISLLAAIAIPSFLSQRDKAHDATAKAGARTAATAIETYATDHDGRYLGATPVALAAIESTIDPVAMSVDVAGENFYGLTVTSSSGNSFSLERLANGIRSYTCAEPGEGGCPAGGDWG